MGHHRSADETDNFQIIRSNPKFPTMQFGDTMDVESIGADILDLRTQPIKEVAEFLDMRFGGSVSQYGCAMSGNRCHDGVFRGSNTGLIEQDVGTGEMASLE